ncbi:hypothetical protein AGMMS49525_03120 [Bacteroidia bacterium]|nr:hypothetical protein AGMMS49525_03120 [Bacteroidia bacterium]
MKHIYYLGIAAALLFSGCSEDEVAPTLSVDKTSINVALPTMAADSIVVTSNSTWTARLENLTDTTWCLVSPSGTGNGVVYVDVLSNRTDDERSAKIILTSGALSKEVNVTQTSVTTAPPENSATINIEMVYVEGNGTIWSFKIGKYEVTEGQWEAVMGSDPSKNKKGANYPVVGVSWYDAIGFISELYKKTGKCYDLPTAEQWVYASKGGKNTHNYIYSGSNTIDQVAWYADNSAVNNLQQRHEVGTKGGNELGIYDMSGNLWEWTHTVWGPGDYYRRRFGGSFCMDARYCEAAFYSSDRPTLQLEDLGFRLIENPM